MENFKKLMTALVTVVTVLSVLTVVAYAANTTDTEFQVSVWLTNEYDHVKTAREKYTNTSVYFYPETTESVGSNLNGATSVRVKVYGTTGSNVFSGSTVENYTLSYGNGSVIVAFVTCQVGVKYKIHNLIYEEMTAQGYKDGDIYAFFSLANTNDDTLYSRITGVWSPDCTESSSYRDAT